MRILTNKYQFAVLLLLSISATGVNAQEQPADDLPDTVIQAEQTDETLSDTDVMDEDELDVDAMDDISIQQEPVEDPASDSDIEIEAEETEQPEQSEEIGSDTDNPGITKEDEADVAAQSALPVFSFSC